MKVAARWDHLEDLVATVSQSVLGLTVNCARCHDHKFDPISQQDYYQLVALLAGVNQQKDEPRIQLSRDRDSETRLRAEQEQLAQELATWEAALRAEYPPAGSPQPVEGLEWVYSFEQESQANPDDQSKSPSGIELQSGKSPRFATAEPPARLLEAVQKSSELTLEVWLRSAQLNQAGPARIVTLSKDSGQRNFTLGQDGSAFDFRLRTTKTDPNGLPSLKTPDGAVTGNRDHVVVTFSRQAVTRIFVNGRLVAEQPTGGDFSNWDASFRLGLGDEFSGGRAWQGEFLLVALYSRALEPAEIKRHFESESRDIQASESIKSVLARATPDQRDRFQGLLDKRTELQTALERVSFSGPAHVVIGTQPPMIHVLARGNPQAAGDVALPAGLNALTASGLSGDFGLGSEATDAQRRLRLAEWLTDRRNPLTARVIVNRLWHYHFGQGIVDTPSDFGFSGSRPSHAALLDELALRLMEGGWKLKELHRLIVTSAVYRQRSQVENAKARAVDADNRLLWRYPARRLEGEVVRDSILFVSGTLNPRVGGPSFRDVTVKLGNNHEFTNPTDEFSPDTCRRTIYRLWARSGNNPLLTSLDCPDPSVMVPRRPGSITPIQAFSLLNNPLMERCAAAFAERADSQSGGTQEAGIEHAFQLALQRAPTIEERELSLQFVQDHGWNQFCLVLLNTNEFAFVE